MQILHNNQDRRLLRQKLRGEVFKRVTLSFYRYFLVRDPVAFRDELYIRWKALGIFGRVYVASEGINAQLSIPEPQLEVFERLLHADARFFGLAPSYALEESKGAFFTLAIKVKPQLVADGMSSRAIDITHTGRHLSAQEFNLAMDAPGAIVLDMRNHYESEVGRFMGALCLDAETFSEALPMALELLRGKEERKILMYCTGGIRCEKAGAFLRHQGFVDVNQLRGGIIGYVRQAKEKGLANRFQGRNFVFDERLGEEITPDILSNCHQCGKPSGRHINCGNPQCHLLFIQCGECFTKMDGCCGQACMQMAVLPRRERLDRLAKLSLGNPGSLEASRPRIYNRRRHPPLGKVSL